MTRAERRTEQTYPFGAHNFILFIKFTSSEQW